MVVVVVFMAHRVQLSSFTPFNWFTSLIQPHHCGYLKLHSSLPWQVGLCWLRCAILLEKGMDVVFMHVKFLMGLTLWCAAKSAAFVFPSFWEVRVSSSQLTFSWPWEHTTPLYVLPLPLESMRWWRKSAYGGVKAGNQQLMCAQGKASHLMIPAHTNIILTFAPYDYTLNLPWPLYAIIQKT